MRGGGGRTAGPAAERPPPLPDARGRLRTSTRSRPLSALPAAGAQELAAPPEAPPSGAGAWGRSVKVRRGWRHGGE
eukprot:13062476-Alexandrium_andersonii.AAC.1